MMLVQELEPVTVRRLTDYRYRLEYPDLAGFGLIVNFEPLVQAGGLQGDFCIIHWQGKPFGRRRWGVFHQRGSVADYQPMRVLDILGKTYSLQLNEREFPNLPSAVLIAENATLEHVEGDRWTIQPLPLSERL